MIKTHPLQIAFQYGLNNPPLIARWKSEFMKYGTNAFVERLKGRIPTMRRTDERAARIISSLRREFKPTEILAALRFPKATYMYWQQRFDRVDPDLQIRIAIEDIRKDHPNYVYRRLLPLATTAA